MAKSSPVRRLVAAIKKGDVDKAASAIAEGVDFSSLVDEIPPLGWTVYENRPEMARLVLNAGCNVDIADSDGSTALQACSSIRSEHLSDKDAVVLAKLLLERGANVMACGRDRGRNHQHAPLAMARRRGKQELAKLLTDNGACAFDVAVTMKDAEGRPIVGEFYYGIPAGCYPIVVSNDSGELTLQNVFPGQFLIGYEDSTQVVVVNDDQSVTPDQLTWASKRK